MTRAELEQKARAFWAEFAAPDFAVDEYEDQVQDMLVVLVDVHNAAVEQCAWLADNPDRAERIRSLTVKP